MGDTADEAADIRLELELWRASDDPVIMPDGANGWSEYVPEFLWDDIVVARTQLAQRVDGTPQVASWAEVLAWSMAASSMPDHATNADFVGLYALSFRRYLAELDADEPRSLPEPSGAGKYITDEVEEWAATLRRDIREQRDAWFTSDGINGLPGYLDERIASANDVLDGYAEGSD